MSEKKHKKNPDTLGRSCICIFAAFLLSVCFLIVALMLSLKIGYINIDQIIGAYSNTGYFTKVYESLLSDCENEASASGLSGEVFDGVFTTETLKADILSYTTETINGSVYEFQTKELEDTLAKNITTYAEKNNLTVDGDLNEVIKNFTENIIDYYKTSVKFPYLDQIAQVFTLFQKLFLYILSASIIFILILLVALKRLTSFKKNRFFRYMAYSLLSASMSLLVIPIFCYQTGFYKKIVFTPEYVYRYVVSYVENGLSVFTSIGIILFVLGLICAIIEALIKKKLKEEKVPAHHHHHHSHQAETK